MSPDIQELKARAAAVPAGEMVAVYAETVRGLIEVVKRQGEALEAIADNAATDTDAVLFRSQAAAFARAALKETTADHDTILALIEVAEAAQKLVSAVDDLISESHGVYGLHQNGDIAPWDTLTEGGQFEDWLMALSEARTALEGVKP